MIPSVVQIRVAEDPRDVIHRAVQSLSAGELVAFPTETLYAVAAQALHVDAVARLKNAGGPEKGFGLTLCLKTAEEALDYVPEISKLGKKLIRRCWPGPVTLCFDVGSTAGLSAAFPQQVRDGILHEGLLAIRVSAHEVVQEILRLMPGPLVLSAEVSDSASLLALAADVADRFGDAVSLVIDDGPARYGQPSTVVSVRDNVFEVLRPGVVSERTLARMAGEVFVFVCTGNTCRSPMAEAWFRKLLAGKLKCREEDLIDRGYVVGSAGLAAAVGMPASPEAVELLQKRGINLRGHESQPLTARLLDQADHIYTMTRGHRDAILAERPDLADRLEPLSRDGRDISDPIGGGMSEYESCEAEIQLAVKAIIEQLDLT